MPALKVWNGTTWDYVTGPPGAAGATGGSGPAGGTFTLQIGGNTSGATASISSGTLTLAGGAGINLNQAGNGITINAPEVTRSLLYEGIAQSFSAFGQGSLHIQPLQIRGAITATEFNWIMSASVSSNAKTLTAVLGIYDVVNSTSLALLSSGSVSYGTHMSGGNSTLYHSVRQWSMPFNMNASRGDYAMALMISTAGAGLSISGAGLGVFGASTQPFQGPAGVAANATNKILPFLGVYSAASAAMPANIPSNAINGSGSNARRYDFMLRALGA